ncbi:MAG: hypothetical protein GXP40_12150 [Chloroflexi bacterium]|nr:hypothetical protein [Chloroflexota bacterium]
MNSSPVRFLDFFKGQLQRGMAFGAILVAALFSFEIFNFSTTNFALTDLLGTDLKFAGIRWATILAFAFCGIDFAGIARLFTPEKGRDEPAEVWYLFGAWLLAAAMNAILTWWGISIAVMDHPAQGSALVSSSTLFRAVPVFVAVMVWLIRVLIIGTFSLAGERLFSVGDVRPAGRVHTRTARPATSVSRASGRTAGRAAPKPVSASARSPRAEPTYHPVGLAASPRGEGNKRRL